VKVFLPRQAVFAAALFLLVGGFSACAGGQTAGRFSIPPGAFDRSASVNLPLKIAWIAPLDQGEFALDFKPVEFSTPVADSRRVYVGVAKKSFYALSASDGRVIWKFDAFGPIESEAALGEGTVILGDSDGMVYCLNAENGLVRWTYKASGEVMGKPLVADGKIFFLTTENRIYALSLDDGKWLWMKQRDVPTTFTVRGVASPVVKDGTLFVCFSDGYIIALNAKNGKEIWKNLLKIDEYLADIDATPVLDGDSLFVSAYDGDLFRLDRENGAVLWKLEGGGGVSAPVLMGDYLFVASSS